MAGAVSALFLLDIKGRVLIWRDYRGDVSAVQAERFFTKLIEKEVFKHYFVELEEESLRDNFVVVVSVLGCGRKCQYSCQQQWTDYPFRCCWGIENENILEVKPPIWVEAQVERHSRSRIEMMVKARSQFKERSTATSVEIELPVPSDATNPSIRTSMGSAAYAPEHDALVWKIKSFPGGKEYMCRAEFTLPSITAEDAIPERKAPVRVKFEIPYFTISGIQVLLVRYLKIIEKSGYQALPWVRYITMAGEYELRLI
ncbi:hypothetical protein BHE74_00011933 [Ensete ventricosum]|nr:hypothetical protein GW17_00007024 [Ensete ventricosum]RWW79758.1 hypothetical protein BHE74_00011933 [Ensete ventricosum]